MNYYKEALKIINKLASHKPKLLLHSCCAPCSSGCIELLQTYFDTDIYFFNPNIDSLEEYNKRLNEQKRFVQKKSYNIEVIEDAYQPWLFIEISKGLENLPEGSSRCFKCYWLRMEATAKKAKELGYDYFTTTLSVSPHKNADWINKIGFELEELYGVKFLPSDFKKNNGYLRSIEASKQHNLYRQNYCGCMFSKSESN